MALTTKSKRVQFSTPRVALRLENGSAVDREHQMLHGMCVMRVGEARGHDGAIDGTTLDQLVALGNAAPKGVKMRFGHPSLCTPGIGTYLGRATHFRREGDEVRADAMLSAVADKGPHGNLAEYVMDMAESEPDMCGCSVAVMGTWEEPDGAMREGPIEAAEHTDDPKMPMLRVTALTAVDVVDEPAATEGMFEAGIDAVQFSARTLVELRRAIAEPGFVAHALEVLETLGAVPGVVDSGSPETGTQLEVTTMELKDITLDALQSGRPDLFSAIQAKARDEALKDAGEKRDLAVTGERARCARILKHAKPHHFAKTAEHANGLIHALLESGAAVEDALDAMIEANEKADKLSALEAQSGRSRVSTGGVTERPELPEPQDFMEAFRMERERLECDDVKAMDSAIRRYPKLHAEYAHPPKWAVDAFKK